ncbi:MAG: hypothetical protein APF77_09520 [Clostridia bacterium BRH_c25]|nr:MAG: hypothetical protein APF77_09520 [Clostridia bacterium BRH_c25]
MKVFIIDTLREYSISYNDFINQMNAMDLKKYIYCKDPKDVFLHLAKSIAFGKEVVLLDGDWSDTELQHQGLRHSEIKEVYSINTEIRDMEDLYNRIEKNKKNWSVSLFTSGTTGKPKKVKHSFSSASRAVRQSAKYADNIWLFSYNPTHFAGLQVFLQAFMNRNTVVIGNDPGKYDINLLLKNYKVTNVSATPSFYRFIIPTLNDQYDSIKNITSGGEKMDEKLKSLLSKKFPSAKITNVYASTEAGSLFAADGEYFHIEDYMADMIKIEDSELCIHRSIMGEFNLDSNDQWYKTGDIVEYLDGKIRFLQRESDFINVGGYIVNPIEVEEEILKIENIIDVLIYGMDNKMLGKILAADVVLAVKEENINKRIFACLANKLQKWKIPRIISIKDKIEKTNTGKKVRKR